eukprot:728766-Amphidinium_carterae.2
MIEFIRSSGMQHLYHAALCQLESAFTGASTDLQLDFSPPVLTGMPFATPVGTTFEAFIAHRQFLAVRIAYEQILAHRLAPLPSPTSPSFFTSSSDANFTFTLKLVTINVRTMNDSGK